MLDVVVDEHGLKVVIKTSARLDERVKVLCARDVVG